MPELHLKLGHDLFCISASFPIYYSSYHSTLHNFNHIDAKYNVNHKYLNNISGSHGGKYIDNCLGFCTV
jgi:hypothetical protein